MARYESGGSTRKDSSSSSALAQLLLGPANAGGYRQPSRRYGDDSRMPWIPSNKNNIGPTEILNRLLGGAKGPLKERMGGGAGNDSAGFEDLGDVATQQLLQQAMGLFSNASLESYDPAADVEAALQGIARQYGAQIKGLQRANNEARATTKASSREIRNMYAALKSTLQRDARNEIANAEELKNLTMATGREAAGETTGRAKELLAENAAVAKGLGSEALLEKLNAPINAQAQRQSGAAMTRAQQGADEALAIGGTAAQGYRQQGAVASMEGTERAADLYDQLQSFVQANADKAAALRGEQSAAQASARSQILSSVANNANEVSSRNNQNLWKAIMDIANLQQGNQENAYDQWLGQQKLLLESQKNTGAGGFEQYYPKGMRNANSILSEFGDPASNVFAEIVNNPTAVQDPSMMKNPAFVMQLINSKAPNIPAREKQALLAATLQYFGG